MGCIKLTYSQEENQPLFLQIWKRKTKEKSPSFFGEALEKNPVSLKKCNDYTPFGLSFNSYTSGTENLYKYSGKEEQKELASYDFGQRMYDPALGRFNRLDRFAEKYYQVSSYSYAANNPINLIDINGDSLWISHAGNNILYDNGSLFNADGTAYTGKGTKTDKNGNLKLKGFLKQTVGALNTIGSTAEGASLLGELQGSANNFTIEKSSTNEFNENGSQRLGAYASQINTDPQYSHLQAAAGGVIQWNPKGANVWTVGGQSNNPGVNLGHELFHARDANRGLMDGRLDQGLKRNEWQATFKENQLRQQMGLPLREYYRSQDNGGVITPLAPRMLNGANQPIRPAWTPAGY